MLLDLGNAYYSLGEMRKAIEFHEKALRIAQEIGDKNKEGAFSEVLVLLILPLAI